MKEYKCFQICTKGYETEQLLNELASHGWVLVCAYTKDNLWLIMERVIK
jgi:hypothetical protein